MRRASRDVTPRPASGSLYSRRGPLVFVPPRAAPVSCFGTSRRSFAPSEDSEPSDPVAVGRETKFSVAGPVGSVLVRRHGTVAHFTSSRTGIFSSVVSREGCPRPVVQATGVWTETPCTWWVQLVGLDVRCRVTVHVGRSFLFVCFFAVLCLRQVSGGCSFRLA